MFEMFEDNAKSFFLNFIFDFTLSALLGGMNFKPLKGTRDIFVLCK